MLEKLLSAAVSNSGPIRKWGTFLKLKSLLSNLVQDWLSFTETISGLPQAPVVQQFLLSCVYHHELGLILLFPLHLLNFNELFWFCSDCSVAFRQFLVPADYCVICHYLFPCGQEWCFAFWICYQPFVEVCWASLSGARFVVKVNYYSCVIKDIREGWKNFNNTSYFF